MYYKGFDPPFNPFEKGTRIFLIITMLVCFGLSFFFPILFIISSFIGWLLICEFMWAARKEGREIKDEKAEEYMGVMPDFFKHFMIISILVIIIMVLMLIIMSK